MQTATQPFTLKQAYFGAYLFLADFYSHHKTEYGNDLPMLLGAMQLWPDGRTADPASEADWQEAGQHQESLTSEEALTTLQKFLEMLQQRGESDEISRLLLILSNLSPELWADWKNSLQRSSQVIRTHA